MTNHDIPSQNPLIQKMKHKNQDSLVNENIPENQQHASLNGKIKKTPGRKKGSTKKLKNNLVPTPFNFEEFCSIGKSLQFQPESQAISSPLSPDISFGALLMSHLRNHCESCWTVDTPQWRKGWYSEILGRVVLLCNACGLKYHKNQFCSYCKFVYGKEIDKTSKKFVLCTSCDKCVHVDCEKRYGNWNIWEKKMNLSENLIRKEYICLECAPSSSKSTKNSTLKSLVKDIINVNNNNEEEYHVSPVPSSSLPSTPCQIPSEELTEDMEIENINTAMQNKNNIFNETHHSSGNYHSFPQNSFEKKNHNTHHYFDEPDYSSATSPLHISYSSYEKNNSVPHF